MDVLKTLQYMKPDIKVCVWENDIDQIFYNETEEFRPTKAEILAVNQSLVSEYHKAKEKEEMPDKEYILNQLQILQSQLLNLKE